MKRRTAIRSDIAWSTPDRIGVLGYDLTRDLIGRINLGDMGFLEVTGRLPNVRESRMFNALLVTLVEHGIVPSTLATRLTYTGAPEAIQAAVAAGLLGLGSVFVGSTESAARMLVEALPDPNAYARSTNAYARSTNARARSTNAHARSTNAHARVALPDLADRIVAEKRAAGTPVPGLGHPIHKLIDPRVPRLFALARANGFGGPYIRLLQLVARRAAKAHGRPLPINATGAIGAICCEMNIPWQACRGLGVMARAVGLVGHVLEEIRRPMAREIWHRIESEATAHARGRLRRKKR